MASVIFSYLSANWF